MSSLSPGDVSGYRIFLPSVAATKTPLSLEKAAKLSQQPLEKRVTQAGLFTLDKAIQFQAISPQTFQSEFQALQFKVDAFYFTNVVAVVSAILFTANLGSKWTLLTSLSRYVHGALIATGAALAFFARSQYAVALKSEEAFSSHHSFTIEDFATLRAQAFEADDKENPFNNIKATKTTSLCLTENERAEIFKRKLETWTKKLNSVWPWAFNPSRLLRDKTEKAKAAAEFLLVQATPLTAHVIQLFAPTYIAKLTLQLASFQSQYQSLKADPAQMITLIQQATTLFRTGFKNIEQLAH